MLLALTAKESAVVLAPWLLAALLYRAALAQPGYYKRVEWWDRAEGPLPHADVEYPKLRKAAAFVCTERQCSTPIFEPQGIADFLTVTEAPPL